MAGDSGSVLLSDTSDFVEEVGHSWEHEKHLVTMSSLDSIINLVKLNICGGTVTDPSGAGKIEDA